MIVKGSVGGRASSGAAAALTAAVSQLKRARAAAEQSLRDDGLAWAEQAQFIALQAALDQLAATLARWESLMTRLAFYGFAGPLCGPDASSRNYEGTGR